MHSSVGNRMISLWNKDSVDRSTRVQYLCLLVAVVLEFLFFALEDRVGGIAHMYVTRYLAFPAMIFLGAALSRELSPEAKRTLMLSAFMLGWFFLTQTIHKAVESAWKETGTFFFVYGMALPFASVMNDGKRQWGLKIVAGLALTVSSLVVAYAGLLTAGLLPSGLEEWVYWDGARFTAMGHPNTCACLLMIGIGVGMGVCLKTKKRLLKALLLALVAGQYVALCLTNSRTTIVMASLLLGGIVFTALRKPGWKRTLPALLAGVLTAALVFSGSDWIFRANNDRLVRQRTAEMMVSTAAEQTQEMNTPETNLQASTQSSLNLNNNGVLPSQQKQESWESDIHTLNGRTVIWKAAVAGLKENEWIMLRGTEYVDFIVSRSSPYRVVSVHNSWLEVLYQLGFPGLLVALILTVMAARNSILLLWRGDDPLKSCIALLTFCLLGCAMLESYLFVGNEAGHYVCFLFLFFLGYLNEWCTVRPKGSRKSS